ncbi:MAG: DUF3488 and transglutaminase-like domain-containing protein [Pseudomonadota bacterium]
MAKNRGTDGSLLGSLPWTLLALGVSVLPHLPYLPGWISAAAIACALWRLIIEKRRWLLPSVWFRGLLALSCFLGVLATYETISGVGPGTALLAVMAALKLLETRKRRDQFVLLFIAIFLVMSALLREQYVWSVPYMFLSLVVTMSAWLRMTASPAQPPRQTVLSAARMVAYALPLAVAMWLFFPRIATPFWAVPIDTSSGVTGLSDTMSPGDISSLSESDAVAFRVRFEQAAPAPRDRYWRALVLHRFNGRTWSGSDPTIDHRFRERIEYRGEPVDYQVVLEPTRTQWIMALDVAESWDLDGTHMGRAQSLWRPQPVDQRIAYAVRSYPEYTIDRTLSGFAQSWYLDLPEGRNPKARQLAESLRRSAGSDRAFVTEVLAKFNQEDFYYTLQPPALGSNPVDSFLFSTRQGFCEHYASAFAVLMRAAGIPARVVLGYQGGELNRLGDYLIVRQADAHAWTEIWLEGSGWQRVDPTAAVAPERIESSRRDAILDGTGAAWGFSEISRWRYRLGMTWDAVNARWNELVLGYGPENQKRFMRWLGFDKPDPRTLVLTLIGLVVGLAAVVHVVLILRFRPPVEDRAKRLFERFAQKTGVAPRRGETPLAYARRVVRETADAAAFHEESGTARAQKIEAITLLYLDVRYGSMGRQGIAQLGAQIQAFRPA